MLEWSHIKNEIRGRGDEKELIISLTPRLDLIIQALNELRVSIYVCVGVDGGMVVRFCLHCEDQNVFIRIVRKPEITHIVTSQWLRGKSLHKSTKNV